MGSMLLWQLRQPSVGGFFATGVAAGSMLAGVVGVGVGVGITPLLSAKVSRFQKVAVTRHPNRRMTTILTRDLVLRFGIISQYVPGVAITFRFFFRVFRGSGFCRSHESRSHDRKKPNHETHETHETHGKD
jgi:hypothetical protein